MFSARSNRAASTNESEKPTTANENRRPTLLKKEGNASSPNVREAKKRVEPLTATLQITTGKGCASNLQNYEIVSDEKSALNKNMAGIKSAI